MLDRQFEWLQRRDAVRNLRALATTHVAPTPVVALVAAPLEPTAGIDEVDDAEATSSPCSAARAPGMFTTPRGKVTTCAAACASMTARVAHCPPSCVTGCTDQADGKRRCIAEAVKLDGF